MTNQSVSGATESTASSHVLAIVPRGEVIRNFAYSGCFDALSKDSRLSILSVPVNPVLTSDLSGSGREVLPLEEVSESWVVRFQREILDLAHGRWLWSKAAQERWRLRDKEVRTARQKTFRIVKKSLAVPFANRPGLRFLSYCERLSSRLLNKTQIFSDLFRSLNPTVVFNGSHIHSSIATPAVQAAQWLGIPTATFVFSWDNLTSQGRIMLPYDYFLVWNETIKKQLLEMYEWIDPNHVFITGTPQFDLHFREENYMDRGEYCERVGADPSRPIVLYTSGMANHMPGEPEIVEHIADVLSKFPTGNRPQLMVRVYAKDLTGRFDELRARRPDIIFADPIWDPRWLTPKPEDASMFVNALRHSAVGINIASTISLELCMFDKPVINIGYDPPSGNEIGLRNARFYSFEHYKPVVDSGAVQVAWSTDEIHSLIANCLSHPEELRRQRKQLIDQMFGNTLDGKSGERVAEAILRLPSRTRTQI